MRRRLSPCCRTERKLASAEETAVVVFSCESNLLIVKKRDTILLEDENEASSRARGENAAKSILRSQHIVIDLAIGVAWLRHGIKTVRWNRSFPRNEAVHPVGLKAA
jgi:hypothetical protein